MFLSCACSRPAVQDDLLLRTDPNHDLGEYLLLRQGRHDHHQGPEELGELQHEHEGPHQEGREV